MRSIISKVIQVVILYVISTIYGYYNSPKPYNEYSWLVSAILLIIVFIVLKIALKNDK